MYQDRGAEALHAEGQHESMVGETASTLALRPDAAGTSVESREWAASAHPGLPAKELDSYPGDDREPGMTEK